MNDQNTTVVKTWLVIDNLFKHRSERHCRHTVEFIVKEALTKSKSAGLAAQTQRQQTQQPPEVNLNGNYTRT